MSKKDLTVEQQEEVLHTLQTRFEENMHRHEGFAWEDVVAKLEENTEKL